MMSVSKCSSTSPLIDSYFLLSSLNTKAEPLEQPKDCAQSSSAYVAAMEEFKSRYYGTLSDASQEI